jgi:hypothetical protein
MVPFNTQFLVFSTMTALFAPSALACLQLSGSASSGFDTIGDLTAVDNGVQTCSGSIGKGDKNLGEYSSALFRWPKKYISPINPSLYPVL